MESVTWKVECGEWPTLDSQREATRALLGRLLGAEVFITHDPQGVPSLIGHPDLNISISHCRRAVAVAISAEGRVGIDVESRRRVSEGLMQRVCSPDELAAVRDSDDPTMAFLQRWTRKEAVLKCRGTGIKGFGSMQSALLDGDCQVTDLHCENSDVVAAMAVSR